MILKKPKLLKNTNTILINILMGADGGRWVRMGADGCTGVQQRQNGVIWARGGVGMHDLGPRVAGKFPGTSC